MPRPACRRSSHHYLLRFSPSSTSPTVMPPTSPQYSRHDASPTATVTEQVAPTVIEISDSEDEYVDIMTSLEVLDDPPPSYCSKTPPPPYRSRSPIPAPESQMRSSPRYASPDSKTTPSIVANNKEVNLSNDDVNGCLQRFLQENPNFTG